MSIQESIDAQKFVTQSFNILLTIGLLVIIGGLVSALIAIIWVPPTSTRGDQAKRLGWWLLSLGVLVALWAAGTYILTPLCCA